jgi:hypothetical protein
MRSHSVTTDSSTGSAAGFILVFLKFFEVLAIDVPHGAITALPPQCSCPSSRGGAPKFQPSFFSLVHTPTGGLSLPWLAPYHRTNPNHRSIVSAIAVQATLVTTRNTKPKPNIASARYSVPTVAPTPTNKAHAARPMRLMFNWKRRLARLQGGFGRDSIGGNTIYIFTSLHLSRAICNVITRITSGPGGLSGRTQPTADAAPHLWWLRTRGENGCNAN